METAFAKPAGDVLASFNVNENTGLSDAQVTELRSKHGRNCMSTSLLAASKPRHQLQLF